MAAPNVMSMLDEILEAVAVPLAVVRRGPGEAFVLDAANARLAALLRQVPNGSCPAAAVLPDEAMAVLREAAATGHDACRRVVLGPGEVPCTLLVRAAPGAGARYVLTFVPEPPAAPEPARTALQILDLQSEMVSRWLPDGTILYCNEAFARQCGRPKDEVIGSDLLALTPPEEIGQILANIRKLSPARPTAAYDHRIPLPDGGERWQEWIDRALFDREGRTLGYLSVGRDITLRKEAERQLEESERRLKLALAAGWQSVWELDLPTGKLRFEPPCLARFGWDEERREYPLAEMLALIHPEDRPRVRRGYEECRAGLRAQVAAQHRLRRRDGSYAWVEDHVLVAERGADGRPLRLVGVTADITARKEAELQLVHLALHDPLTGLPNRRAFVEMLDRGIAQAERRRSLLALLLLDLDGFKTVNDRHGHPAGDRVLVAAAAGLRQAVRRSDVLARLGGDEFAVVAGELRSKGAVVRLAGRIRAAIQKLAATLEVAALLDVSIGVAFFPNDGGTPDRLFMAADAALYAAKRERAGWRFAGSRLLPMPHAPERQDRGAIGPANGMAASPS